MKSSKNLEFFSSIKKKAHLLPDGSEITEFNKSEFQSAHNRLKHNAT